jgi:hypothetical protein
MCPSASNCALTDPSHAADDRDLNSGALLCAFEHTIKRLQLAFAVYELARSRRQIAGDIRGLSVASA